MTDFEPGMSQLGRYNVNDEPDYARTYDEDEVIEVRKGDVRAVLDVATMSMDFGSGFLDNEQVEALRKCAEMLGIDPIVVTPFNFVCQYVGHHRWKPSLHFRYEMIDGVYTNTGEQVHDGQDWCPQCHATRPTP